MILLHLIIIYAIVFIISYVICMLSDWNNDDSMMASAYISGLITLIYLLIRYFNQ